MMQNLCLAEGDFLNVESAILPLGNYAQVQPQSKEFLDIYNPKAVYPCQHFCVCVCVRVRACVCNNSQLGRLSKTPFQSHPILPGRPT